MTIFEEYGAFNKMWLETVSLISLRIFLFRLMLICFSSNPLFYEMTFTSVEIEFGAKFQLFCDWQFNTVFILLLEELLTAWRRQYRKSWSRPKNEGHSRIFHTMTWKIYDNNTELFSRKFSIFRIFYTFINTKRPTQLALKPWKKKVPPSRSLKVKLTCLTSTFILYFPNKYLWNSLPFAATSQISFPTRKQICQIST